MSLKPTPREIKLARALVHPEKPIRDETLRGLEEYLQCLTEISDLEMLKMWKALYYCYWLADKQPIQMEMAERFSSIIHSMKNSTIVLSYFKSFCIILLREWSYLDQYRVNKFYSLIRIVFRNIFAFLKNAKWEKSLIESFSDILTTQILTKQPNGVRYHVCDLYLQELLKVTEGKLSTKDFLVLIQPFLDALVRHDDLAFIERVYKAVFFKFIQELCQEREKKDQEESEAQQIDGKADKKHYFHQVNTKQLQKIIFDFASAEETNERFRKRLYDLHKEIGHVTGFPFITEEVLNGTTSNTTGSGGKGGKNKKKRSNSMTSDASGDLVIESAHAVSVPHSNTTTTTTTSAAAVAPVSGKKRKNSEDEPETTTSSNKKKKNTTKELSAIKEADEEEEQPPVVETKKMKKDKKTRSGSEDHSQPPMEVETVPVVSSESNKKTKNNKTPKKEEVIPAIPTTPAEQTKKTPSKKETKKDEGKSSSSSPVATAVVPPAVPSSFIAAPKFQGAKAGYFFQKVSYFNQSMVLSSSLMLLFIFFQGSQGVGYYLDNKKPVKGVSFQLAGKDNKKRR
jgi:ribosomal RNA-processing protein 1